MACGLTPAFAPFDDSDCKKIPLNPKPDKYGEPADISGVRPGRIATRRDIDRQAVALRLMMWRRLLYRSRGAATLCSGPVHCR